MRPVFFQWYADIAVYSLCVTIFVKWYLFSQLNIAFYIVNAFSCDLDWYYIAISHKLRFWTISEAVSANSAMSPGYLKWLKRKLLVIMEAFDRLCLWNACSKTVLGRPVWLLFLTQFLCLCLCQGVLCFYYLRIFSL